MCFQKEADAAAFVSSPLLVSLLKYINIKEIATEISQRTCEERKFYVLGTQGKTSSQDLMGFSIFRESLRLA